MARNIIDPSKLATTGTDINVRTHLQAQIYLQVPTGAANGTPGRAQVGVGRLRNFEAEQDFGTEEVYGIGAYEANEIVNLKFAGSLSLEAFSIRKADLVKLGLAALGKKILQSSYLELDIYDPIDQTFLRSYKGVVIGRHTETIREGEICGERASCKYITVEEG